MVEASLWFGGLVCCVGRDPNQLGQLKGVNHMEVGLELLEAAF